MKSLKITGTSRTIAERSSEQARSLKEVRANGGVPCVLYGQKTEPVHFIAEHRILEKLVFTPEIFEVKLEIDGKEYLAIMKDLQLHPVKDSILHIDFYLVDPAKPIVVAVPVKLEGLAEGVRTGGKLVLQMRKIRVKALISDIPEKLTIDVTPLGLGKTMKVGELNFGDKLELTNAKEAVVCAVQLTRAARGAAAAAAAAK